ncbi:hypothetical protein MASR1M68_06870 [Elusimicrobiota bacterium]
MPSGCVVCDISVPHNITEHDADKTNVLVIDGGLVQVPCHVDFEYLALPPGVAYACLSEAMILSLEGRFESFSYGGEISYQKIIEINSLANKHGFKLANFRSFGKIVREETIEKIKMARKTENKMWIFFAGSSLAASVFCITFAVLSFTNNRKSELNTRFAIVSFVIGMWALFPFIVSVLANYELALFYGRFLYIFALFTPPAFFHFVFVTIDIHERKLNKYLIRVFYIISCIFTCFSYSDLFIKGVVSHVPNALCYTRTIICFLYIVFFGTMSIFYYFII